MRSTQNAVNNHEYRSVPITALAESPTNPRKRFDAKSLEELAASFKTQGILAPLLVGELEESRYEVVAGARRLRAAKLAELDKLPVRVVKLTDAEAIEAQCVENLQREDFVRQLSEANWFQQTTFPDVRKDSCTSPDCFRAKIDASVKKTLEPNRS